MFAGAGQQVAHHLDQALCGDHVGHPRRVLLGQRQEQRLLVAKMVEDGATGQAGGFLEAPDRGTLVAVAREADS